MAKKFENLQAPAALRDLKGWLVWRWVRRPDRPKALKMPYYLSGSVRNKTHGSAEDRQFLGTFEEARAFAEKQDFSGVGLALMPEFGITALDFDNCVVDGTIDPVVERLTAGTYTEFSPSGTGVRAFMLGASPDSKDSTPVDGSFGFETFHAKGFVTFTGQVTGFTEETGFENTVAPISEAVRAFCATRFKRIDRIRAECVGAGKPTFGMSPEQIADLLTKLPDQLCYDDWVAVGMCIHHETEGEGFDVWDEWSSRSPKYTNSEYSMERWRSFGQNKTADYKTMGTVLQMIRESGGNSGFEVATLDDFEDLGEDKSKPRGFHGFFSIDEFEGQASKVNWFIKGFLPHAQLAILFGPSGSGKSFLAFDMCAAIARGLETWNGKRITKGRVAYLVAEGVSGFRQRIKAYRAEHGVDASDIDMTIIAGVVPNLTNEDSVKRLTRDMEKFGPYDLIVFDTFAQVTSGANENSGEEMSTALKHCREIAQACGAMSLLVHHSGKDDTKGARGWSGLKAAADVELEVKRDKDGVKRSVSITKMKDGEDNISQGFELRTVVMGKDEDGDDITSCVVEYNAEGKVETNKVRMGTNQKIIMRSLDDLLKFNSGNPVARSELIAAAVELMPIKEGARQDMRSTRANEALDALICNKCVSAENDMISAGSADL